MSTIHQAASKLKGRKKKKRFEPRRRLFKSPQKKGLVEMCRIMTPRKPNSAKRKICKVNIHKTINRRRPYWILAKLRGITGFTNKWIDVLVTGGRANDLPGVKYLMIRNKFGLGWRENHKRSSRLSKYGITYEMFKTYIEEDWIKTAQGMLYESDDESDERIDATNEQNSDDDLIDFTEEEKEMIRRKNRYAKK